MQGTMAESARLRAKTGARGWRRMDGFMIGECFFRSSFCAACGARQSVWATKDAPPIGQLATITQHPIKAPFAVVNDTPAVPTDCPSAVISASPFSQAKDHRRRLLPVELAKMQVPPSSDGIQRLIAAEQEAQRIVGDARKGTAAPSAAPSRCLAVSLLQLLRRNAVSCIFPRLWAVGC